MPFAVSPSARLLFQGDSITAAGRDPADGLSLGHGYVAAVARHFAASGATPNVLNRGVSGHRTADLRARWERDAVELKPDVLSVMVGINDTWRRYDAHDPTSTADFARDYRELLLPFQDTGTQLVLIEPFLIPVRREQWAWREDLDPRIHAVRRLAAEFDAALLAADGLLNQAAREAGDPALISDDGVHLTARGHYVLAAAWTGLARIG
ncbi:GDSL-type esterase/lipase family protein [Streptomyces justiciae]|uniref:GDSL-type esterase/lipase family protein n=1 Tax=Streptomyces justiciae TaxID=2780140 RepID=A0ABU3LM78_9ACTN|nr:GDSL-type esterase/lipase family protein [Streptomyces justiciae]MDT7839662.1 GDSL-type esterase/lipase family protein [Streptomyces justiciae]